MKLRAYIFCALGIALGIRAMEERHKSHDFLLQFDYGEQLRDAILNGYCEMIRSIKFQAGFTDGRWLTIRYDDGQSPLEIAISADNPQIVQCLLDLGALNLKNPKTGKTPVHEAVLSGRKECLKVLLKHNPFFSRDQDDEGNTPLHLTSLLADTSMASLLLSRGAEADAMNLQGMTVFQLAQAMNNEKLIELLMHPELVWNEVTDDIVENRSPKPDFRLVHGSKCISPVMGIVNSDSLPIAQDVTYNSVYVNPLIQVALGPCTWKGATRIYGFFPTSAVISSAIKVKRHWHKTVRRLGISPENHSIVLHQESNETIGFSEDLHYYVIVFRVLLGLDNLL